MRILLAFSFLAATAVQAQKNCKDLFILSDTSIVRVGDTVVFTALFREQPSTLDFQWKAVNGKVLNGNGTNTIRILPTGAEGSEVRATVSAKGCSASSPLIPVVPRDYGETYRTSLGEMYICLLQNGQPERVEVMSHIGTDRLDTLVFRNGKRLWFREAWPLTNEYGVRHAWFRKGETIVVNGERYRPFGNSSLLEPHLVEKIGTYKGVPVFRPTTEITVDAEVRHLIVLPVTQGCEYKIYASESFLNNRKR